MQRVPMLSVILVGMTSATTTGQSNIDPGHKFAWGENIGWTNWRDANDSNDGVMVGATYLSGFIWAENVGWINVGDGTPADGVHYTNSDGLDFGVNVDANGDLFGFSWGENIGWINFDTSSLGEDRVRFDDSQQRFFGYLWAENVGWINLDDGDHFVAANTCTTDADCNDDNVCTQDQCITGSCEHSGKTYGDVDNDGDVDLFDLFCILNCFAADFATCTFEKCDLDPCEGDADVDLFDLFAVLNAFSGIDPCCGGLP